MTIDEIFTKLATHMINGLMYHDEFARAYDFMGLYGFAKLHRYHYIEELINYNRLLEYYNKFYRKLLKIENPNSQNIIPESWFKYTTLDVDTETKKSSIKELMNTWIKWERETKEFYQSMYNELLSIQEVDAAEYIKYYIHDVSKELCHAEKKLIKLETINYDIVHIAEWQSDLYNKYKKKLGW